MEQGTVTAAERLLALSKATGAASALLLAIGSGVTAEAALLDYSVLESVTAAEHLLYDKPASGHGGADGSSARLAREAVEKARRKAEQKQIDRDRKVAQEALDALNSSRETLVPIQGRSVSLTEAFTESLTENLQQAESRGIIEPLSTVNELFAKLAPAIIVPVDGDNLLPTGNNDEALALIMILAELD
jgi:hypothetical protein